MDISTAFLNGILEEDVYMTQPPGYEDGTGRVCKLKKSIYGLKQAPRCWYQKLAAVLEEMGFRTSSCDESIFLKGEGKKLVLFQVYVDDILLFSSSMKEIQNVQQQQFQSLVGSLLYAAVHTRPDISFSVGQLARVVQNPSEEQVDAAERALKYLNSHPSIGVQYSASAQVKQKGVEVLKEKWERLGEGKLFLTCFTDATWGSEKDDFSSVGGYICVVGGGPVSWRSKKQTETALSSVESEYMAIFHGVKESNGGAEKKERTAGQFFHIGEQGEQGDASAKVGAELHPLDYWVLDTGAAWTMTPRKELFDDVRASPLNEMCSASGHALKVAGVG
ncbi:unnamed protein product [Closterium sp. NIES-54]